MSTVPTGLAGRGRRGWALGAAGAPLAPAGGWGPGAAPLAAAGRWSNEEAWEAWEACHRPDSEGSQGETGSEAGAHSPRPAVDSICLGGRSPTPPHCLTPLSALSRILRGRCLGNSRRPCSSVCAFAVQPRPLGGSQWAQAA